METTEHDFHPANLSGADLDLIGIVMNQIRDRLYSRYLFHEHWGLEKSEITRCIAEWPCKPQDAWIAFACLHVVAEDEQFATVWEPMLVMKKTEFAELLERFCATGGSVHK